MLPEWMIKDDEDALPVEGGAFIIRTIKSVAEAISRIQFQNGRENHHNIPVLIKLGLLLIYIVLLSATRSRLPFMAEAALLLFLIAMRSAAEIARIFKTSFFAACFSFAALLPAVAFGAYPLMHALFLTGKLFLSVSAVALFAGSTQWNHLTAALGRLGVGDIIIFSMDITFKYIVLLGCLVRDLLEALLLRSVGKNKEKYASVGGVMGVVFLRGMEMNEQMVEAMRCRCFTGEYRDTKNEPDRIA